MAEYIEREAALDVVNGWRDQLITTYGENDEYVKCLETVAENLESLLAADVREVVKAAWKRIDYKPCGHDYECSACGWKNDMETHFCPNCGADMREAE